MSCGPRPGRLPGAGVCACCERDRVSCKRLEDAKPCERSVVREMKDVSDVDDESDCVRTMGTELLAFAVDHALENSELTVANLSRIARQSGYTRYLMTAEFWSAGIRPCSSGHVLRQDSRDPELLSANEVKIDRYLQDG